MDFNDEFVTAVNSHGSKQRIPRTWLDHPTLGAGFRLPQSQVEIDRIAGGPTDEWTVEQLREHAATYGVDAAGLRTKADLLDAIDAHTPQTPDPAQGTEETPPAGDDEEN